MGTQPSRDTYRRFWMYAGIGAVAGVVAGVLLATLHITGLELLLYCAVVGMLAGITGYDLFAARSTPK